MFKDILPLFNNKIFILLFVSATCLGQPFPGDVIDSTNPITLQSVFQTQSGAAQRPIANILRDLSKSLVTSWGAKCDGATDDRQAFQNALNQPIPTGAVARIINIPTGVTCMIKSLVGNTNPILTLNSNTTIQGSGWNSVIKIWNNNGSFSSMFEFPAVAITDVTIKDLRFDQNCLANTSQMIADTYGYYTAVLDQLGGPGGSVNRFRAEGNLFDEACGATLLNMGFQLGSGEISYINNTVHWRRGRTGPFPGGSIIPGVLPNEGDYDNTAFYADGVGIKMIGNTFIYYNDASQLSMTTAWAAGQAHTAGFFGYVSSNGQEYQNQCSAACTTGPLAPNNPTSITRIADRASCTYVDGTGTGADGCGNDSSHCCFWLPMGGPNASGFHARAAMDSHTGPAIMSNNYSYSFQGLTDITTSITGVGDRQDNIVVANNTADNCRTCIKIWGSDNVPMRGVNIYGNNLSLNNAERRNEGQTYAGIYNFYGGGVINGEGGDIENLSITSNIIRFQLDTVAPLLDNSSAWGGISLIFDRIGRSINVSNNVIHNAPGPGINGPQTLNDGPACINCQPPQDMCGGAPSANAPWGAATNLIQPLIAITSASGNGTLVTLTTAPHTIPLCTSAGTVNCSPVNITVAGVSIGGYNGYFMVNTVPDTTHVTYLNSTTGSGTGGTVQSNPTVCYVQDALIANNVITNAGSNPNVGYRGALTNNNASFGSIGQWKNVKYKDNVINDTNTGAAPYGNTGILMANEPVPAQANNIVLSTDGLSGVRYIAKIGAAGTPQLSVMAGDVGGGIAVTHINDPAGTCLVTVDTTYPILLTVKAQTNTGAVTAVNATLDATHQCSPYVTASSIGIAGNAIVARTKIPLLNGMNTSIDVSGTKTNLYCQPQPACYALYNYALTDTINQPATTRMGQPIALTRILTSATAGSILAPDWTAGNVQYTAVSADNTIPLNVQAPKGTQGGFTAAPPGTLLTINISAITGGVPTITWDPVYVCGLSSSTCAATFGTLTAGNTTSITFMVNPAQTQFRQIAPVITISN